MKRLLAATALAVVCATPAFAVVLSPADVGDTATINYTGVIGGNNQPGLTAQTQFTLDSFIAATNTFFFSYTASNTSSGVITDSRLTSFGFDTNPELVQANTTVSGPIIDSVVFNASISGGVNVDFCATTANCSGGGGDGVLPGGSTSGTFVLDFADGIIPLINVTDFTVRFQSIAGSAFGDSGIGIPGGPVVFCPPGGCPTNGVIPLPGAAWLFLSGIVGLGFLARCQRKQQLA